MFQWWDSGADVCRTISGSHIGSDRGGSVHRDHFRPSPFVKSLPTSSWAVLMKSAEQRLSNQAPGHPSSSKQDSLVEIMLAPQHCTMLHRHGLLLDAVVVIG